MVLATTSSSLAVGRFWRGWLVRLGQTSLNLLFPPQCVGCGSLGVHLCAACAQAVQPVAPPICARCGRPQARPTVLCHHCGQAEDVPLQMVRAAALFRDPLRPAIHRLKYENSPELGEVLARYLIAAFAGADWQALPTPIDVVVPVPLHRQRLAQRGYNQAALLAQALARAVGLPARPNWLERHQETRSQVGLGMQERLCNVANAFTAHPAVAGKRLLLVDDVFTTGATMSACARAALAVGAVAVYGLALAVPAGPEPLGAI